MKQVTLVLGTARTDNASERVFATLATQFAAESDITLETVRVADHVPTAQTVPPWSANGAETEPTEWQAIAARTDTFVFVLPEYNHSFPGEWKLLIDRLFAEYANKQAAVVGVSDGVFGGARVVEHVMPILVNFKFNVLPQRLHVRNVQDVFTPDGEVVEADMEERVRKFVTAIVK